MEKCECPMMIGGGINHRDDCPEYGTKPQPKVDLPEDKLLYNFNIQRLIYDADHNINQDRVEDLKRSIRQYGIRSPIRVKADSGYYKIIDGVHRFLAANELGHTSIPGILI